MSTQKHSQGKSADQNAIRSAEPVPSHAVTSTGSSDDRRPVTTVSKEVHERLGFEEVRLRADSSLSEAGISTERQAARRAKVVW